MKLSLRYDLRRAPFGADWTELYEACLEQCEWADRVGFDYVRLTEHHGDPGGFMCSPLTVAAAILGRTRRLRVRVACLLLPLHDPVRVAEDIATIDLLSRGRLEVALAAGYMPTEYAMFDKDFGRRPTYMLEGIDLIKRALEGEEVVFRGRPVRVTPRPYTRPRPRIFMGGSSEAAARRAAGRADGFEGLGKFEEIYVDECRKLGIEPGHTTLDSPRLTRGNGFLHVTLDPQGDWDRIAPFAMYETTAYQQMASQSATELAYSSMSADTETSLGESGEYPVLTPEETVERATALGQQGDLRLHPLMGGMPVQLGWASLRLLESDVLPELRRQGLVDEMRTRKPPLR